MPDTVARSPSTNSYRWMHIAIAFIMIAIGLVCLIIEQSDWSKAHHILAGLVGKLSEVIMVGGVLGLVYEFLLRKELVDQFEGMYNSSAQNVEGLIKKIEDRQSGLDAHMEGLLSAIEQRLSLSGGVRTLGLSGISPKESTFDYSEIILKAKKLTFVFNDGRTWFSQHQADLADRLSNPELETTVVLVHQESPFIGSLGRRVDQTEAELAAKIQESVRNIRKLAHGDNLTIWGHVLPTSYSLILSEEMAIYVPYPMARKEDKIPAFVFSAEISGGFYHLLKRDVGRMISHYSRKLYPEELAIEPPERGRLGRP